MDKSLRNASSNYKLSISGKNKALIFWIDFYCVLQDNPQFWSVPICDTIHTCGTWRHWICGRGRKVLWCHQDGALEATRSCCREMWRNKPLCLTGWMHFSLCCRKNNQLRGLCAAAVPGRVLNSHEIMAFLMLDVEILPPSLRHIFLHLNPPSSSGLEGPQSPLAVMP